ncbi:MAG TPA: GMC family oxidoreductase [Gemmatimonadales bacterium]|nr:GMC family oxidoreductase [Gemmatimonadales bacterium]
MSIIDARELAETGEFATDICIIGSGAAGLTLASQLDAAGQDVCVLESGGFQPESETQSLNDLENLGYPIRENFMSRARYYGGSCNIWAGRSMLYGPSELACREWVTDSGWPLPYPELARHLPGAAKILGLPSVELFDPERHRAGLSASEISLYATDALTPTVSLWAPRPKRFGAAYRGQLRRSRNIRLILHASAVNLNLDESGTRIASVDAATISNRRFRIRARTVVLACGGMENARLLLLSRGQHSNGIGNANDLVGRYFMDHPRAVYGRVRLHPSTRLSLLDGYPRAEGKVQFGIGFSPELQRREGLLDHYATLEMAHSDYTAKQYHSFIRTMKVLLRKGYAGNRWDVGRARLGDISGLVYLLTPRELMPHPLYRAYWRARRLVRGRRGGGERVVVYFCEQPPDRESRVTLSDQRDQLGLNRIALHWNVGAAVEESVLRLQSLLQQRLAETGLGTLEPGQGPIRFTDASHHMGTTRMSHSPRTGVVDLNGMVHGVEGLYVAGSSVFPSASNRNPTFTIVALALRLAQHLTQRAGGPA